MRRDIVAEETFRVRASKQWQQMILLTFALIGLQFTWGVEMTYFTPHLLQLGLAKSQTSLVWIAPPLSGLIVQPIVGTISDASSSRWGRRRPWILGCSFLVAVFLCTLAWSSEIAAFWAWNDAMSANLTVGLAVFCIYAVDFAINAVQATARSLIVDTLPQSSQQLGSAWAGRMLGFGHVLGYFAGTIDLRSFFGDSLGDSQFKQICIIASAAIVTCSTVTCLSVQECVLSSSPINDHKSGPVKMLRTIMETTLNLPKRIQAVCWITFLSWIGWSPFFVYGTTWVGETYYQEDAKRAGELKGSKDVVADIARKGSLALVLFSLISFAGSLFLPFLVESAETRDSSNIPSQHASARKSRMAITTAWATSQIAFASAMILTPLSRSFRFATILVALCGLPWAMYGWAPLAILGEEINRLEGSSNNHSYTALSHADTHELSTISSSSESASTSTLKDKSEASLPTAGIYLGIWNIFATIPQFLAIFISMIAFSILEPGKSPELAGDADDRKKKVVRQGLSGTAVCLAIGAICSFIAGMKTFRLRRTEK